MPRGLKPPQSTPVQRKAMRAHVAASCERRPGVYRMLGPTGIVLYVGQSRTLRARLLSYFRARGRRNKAARILRHAFAVEWEYTNTEFGALLRELRLIKQHRPSFNAIMVSDEWPRAYVALTGGVVPGLQVVPRSDDPAAIALFGPFRRVVQLRDAVRALAETTGVRDCALDDIGRGKVRARVPGCLRYEFGTCSGPCIGQGDAAAYISRVTEARDFLEGRSNAPIVHAEFAMADAANSLQFERAALVRDRLALLRWLHERVTRFRANVDRLTCQYQAVGADGREWVYLVRRGTVRAEVPAPVTADDDRALDQLRARVFDGPDPTGADIPTHDLDEFYLVASWFRRHKDEWARAVTRRR